MYSSHHLNGEMLSAFILKLKRMQRCSRSSLTFNTQLHAHQNQTGPLCHMLEEIRSHRTPHPLLVGVEDGQPLCKTVCQFLIQWNIYFIAQFSWYSINPANQFLGCRREGKTCLQKGLHENIFGNFIHKRQGWEATQMPINKTDKRIDLKGHYSAKRKEKNEQLLSATVRTSLIAMRSQTRYKRKHACVTAFSEVQD